MDKITVLIPQKNVLSEHIECVPIGDKIFDSDKINKFIHDEPCMFPSPKRYVEITDQEIKFLAQELEDSILAGEYSTGLKDGFLKCYEFIKSRIKQ